MIEDDDGDDGQSAPHVPQVQRPDLPPAGASPARPPPLDTGRAGSRWMKQAVRSAFLMRADWTGLRATPRFVAALVVLSYVAAVLLERLYIVGAATFAWQGMLGGWMGSACMAWACWLLASGQPGGGATRPAAAGDLFGLWCAQSIVFTVVLGIVFVPLAQLGVVSESMSTPGQWAAWLLPAAWVCAARIRLLWLGTTARNAPRVLAAVLVVTLFGAESWLFPARFWYAARPPAREAEAPTLKLTQELMESQSALLARRLDALRPQRPGIVDVYAITFAPYASQDVFMRESAMVAGVIAQRFDADGRTIQLVNNVATVDEFAWATPLNLKRAIARAAQRMNRAEDVLFIHLASHGGADGKLSADFWPMTVASVTPQDLARWLDDAGVRYRVVSVSACYAGSWIAPLAGDGTLVMTAADADHTSFGCGSRSPLTYFGKAMYDEEMRRTWSFERAHAAARKSIEAREVAAGKTDGYSNPQIRVGAAIARQLVLLEAQHAASAALGTR